MELASASAEEHADATTLFTGAGEHVVVEVGVLGLSAEGDAVADLRREGLVPLVAEERESNSEREPEWESHESGHWSAS